ncbi:5619_t:CDS:2 [Entrophospora sp. SA101]|nr:5619_t:CDS:2 [Entrophospora sp. SA101]
MVDDVETSTSSSHETSIPDHSTSSSKTLKKRKEIVVKPKWCNDEEYAEIQSFTKRPSFKSLPKHIIELLKKSLGSLGFEIKKFKLNTNIYFLEEIPKSKGNDQFSDDLEKIRSSILSGGNNNYNYETIPNS